MFPRSVEAMSRHEGYLKAARAAATAMSTDLKRQICILLQDTGNSARVIYHHRRRQRRQKQSLSRHFSGKILVLSSPRLGDVIRGIDTR